MLCDYSIGWSRCTKLVNCTYTCLARRIFMQRQRIKDLLLRACVVVRTKNEIITSSFGRLRQKISPKSRAPRAARLFSLIRPIKSLICDVVFVISYFLISETKERAKYTRARIGEHFGSSFRVACPPFLACARVFPSLLSLVESTGHLQCKRFAKFDSPINSKL